MNTQELLQLIDNQEVVNFRAISNRPLALVDLAILKRVVWHLPKASVRDIKDAAINHINQCSTVEEIVAFMEDEIAFHKSVNLIREYKSEEEQFEQKLKDHLQEEVIKHS